jgi:hypothetical protein
MRLIRLKKETVSIERTKTKKIETGNFDDAGKNLKQRKKPAVDLG